MRHFPSITEEEFHEACQNFYDRATRAPGSHGWLYVTYDPGVLSIQKEYLIGVPNTPTQKPLATTQDEDHEELTDDEDDEVSILNHLLVYFVSPSD